MHIVAAHDDAYANRDECSDFFMRTQMQFAKSRMQAQSEQLLFLLEQDRIKEFGKPR